MILTIRSTLAKSNILKNAYKNIVKCLSSTAQGSKLNVQSCTIPPPISFPYQNIQGYNLPNSHRSLLGNISTIKLPELVRVPLIKYNPDIVSNIAELPANNKDNEIQAARLIVIRRKKMKKHKLRKVRKKLKFERSKARQKREMKKEKEFQAGLIMECRTAESFSAEKYVEERLSKSREVIEPPNTTATFKPARIYRFGISARK